MIFYQQAAIADKKLRPDDLKAARWDTAVGTVLTQCLTGAVLIAAAATLASSGVSANLAPAYSVVSACRSLTAIYCAGSGPRTNTWAFAETTG
jgi:Mn2+/Fe2+ NRAMP family transporter